MTHITAYPISAELKNYVEAWLKKDAPAFIPAEQLAGVADAFNNANLDDAALYMQGRIIIENLPDIVVSESSEEAEQKEDQKGMIALQTFNNEIEQASKMGSDIKLNQSKEYDGQTIGGSSLIAETEVPQEKHAMGKNTKIATIALIVLIVVLLLALLLV